MIVVDDASGDGSWDYVASAFPGVHLLRSEGQGFGAACNTGVRVAENGLVLLLNNDIRPAPDFLSPLPAHFEHPEVFAVGCKFLRADGSLRGALGNRTRGEWCQGQLHLHHEMEETRLRKTCPQLYANGGAMAVRRDRFFLLGGFDSLYRPFYWEDVDLSYRAWKRGWRVLYEPASVVYHEQAASTGRLHRPQYVQAISHKNGLLFLWKNLHQRPRLAEHLARLPRWLADDILIEGEFVRARALLLALTQLDEAAVRRAAAARGAFLSDEEVLARSAASDD